MAAKKKRDYKKEYRDYHSKTCTKKSPRREKQGTAHNGIESRRPSRSRS